MSNKGHMVHFITMALSIFLFVNDDISCFTNVGQIIIFIYSFMHFFEFYNDAMIFDYVYLLFIFKIKPFVYFREHVWYKREIPSMHGSVLCHSSLK